MIALPPVQAEPDGSSGRGLGETNGRASKDANDHKSALERFNGLQTLEDRVVTLASNLRAATVALEGNGVRGSGVIIRADGRILTAAHVVGTRESPLRCTLSDGRIVPARTIHADDERDTATVQITAPGDWPHVPVAEKIALGPGDWTLALGVPDGTTDGAGALLRLGRVIRVSENSIQTDCPLAAGDSGGPLFDVEGRVVALHGSIGAPLSWNYHRPLSPLGPTDRRLSDDGLTNGAATRAAFTPATRHARQCTVAIRCNGRRVALGTIVQSDGIILTKASSLTDRISCRLSDGREFVAQMIGVDREWDLALLEIPATGLVAARWQSSPAPAVGRWLATPGLDEVPIAVGVVASGPTASGRRPGQLGISYEPVAGGLRVTHVVEASAAAKAGLEVGDLLTHGDGKSVGDDGRRLAELVAKRAAGDPISLHVTRGVRSFHVRAVLELSPEQRLDRAALFHHMGGHLSPRRTDFPVVIPHTSPLKPTECGGPVVDLEGSVVGLNIARAGRTTSYTIPAEKVLQRLAALQSRR